MLRQTILLYILKLGSDNFESSPDVTTTQTLAILTDKRHLSVDLIGITPVMVLVCWLTSMGQFYASAACLCNFCPFSYTVFLHLFFFLSQIGSHVAQEDSNS